MHLIGSSAMLPFFILFLSVLGSPCAAANNDSQFRVAKQFDKSVQNVAAGEPSTLWTSKARRKPLPTNKYWQNFVLNHGSTPEYVHPYTIQSGNGSISISYPKREPSTKSITQVHTDDLIVSSKDSYDHSKPVAHTVVRYDDLTVTLELGQMRVPLVRGSPYISFIFSEPAFPSFSTIHSILNVSTSPDSKKHSLYLNNGQKWNVYTSSPIELSEVSDEELLSKQPYTGVVRVALISDASRKKPLATMEPILDSFSQAYVSSARVAYDTNSNPAAMYYAYKTEGTGPLLLLGLPIHRETIDYEESRARLISQVSYCSIDGELQGIVGHVWKVKSKAPTSSIGWHSVAGVRDPSAAGQIGAALARDVANLRPINTSSTYFFGKAIAKAARLALIAEELGISQLTSNVANFLDANLSPWFDGSSVRGNSIVYDGRWGGLVSQQGAFDSGADFGLGVYNDHHYHWGYFVYAGAVLAKLDPEWGSRYRTNLYSLVGDYMSPRLSNLKKGSAGNFPRHRHFDPWVMHSWAGGLTEFSDGRNQESTSEAVNAYYAAALLGRAYGDEELVKMGSALAGFECLGAKSLWHIRSDSDMYESEFVANNRINGVLWANKRDSSLWFSCGDGIGLECRVGIQVIPVTPVTEALFDDVEYNRELYEWVLPGLQTDPWKAFAHAVQATYDPNRAKANVDLLQKFDDGNSLSNMLWWMYTRPPLRN